MTRPTPRIARLRVAARDRLLDAMTENLGYKTLAAAFALAIWAGVQSQKVVEKRARARVHYVWPDGLVRAEEVPRTLVLTVEGAQAQLSQLGESQLSVTVDLSESAPGPNAVDFTQRTVEGLPQGVTIVQISPPAADVVLDRAMRRTVKVRPATIGEIDPRCRLVGITAYPPVIEVEGPQGAIKNIADATTDLVDIAGLCQDRTVKAPIVFKDRTVSASPEEVEVRVHIDPVVVEKTFNDVVIAVSRDGWKLEPDTARIVLTGPAGLLANVAPQAVRVDALVPEDADRSVWLAWSRDADAPVRVTVDGGDDAISVKRVEPTRFKLVPPP